MASRSLLSRWLRLTLGLLVLAGAAAAAVHFALRRGPDLEGLYRQLPSDTANVVVLQHLDRLLPALTRLAASPGAPPELVEAVASLRRDSLAQAGFDATAPAEWSKAGLAAAGAYALAAPAEGDGLVFAYLPVEDGEKATATLARVLANLGAQVAQREEQKRTVSLITWSPARPELAPRAFALSHGNLVLALAPEGVPDVEARLHRQLSASGLLHTPALRQVREALPEPWVVFGFVSPAQAQRTLAAREQGAAAFAPYATGGLGFSLLLSDARISGRIRILGEATAPGYARLPQVKPPADHLGGAPLAIARVSVDLPGWLASSKETAEGRAALQRLHDLAAAQGIDLEAELTQTFDGQFAAAALAPLGEAALPDGVALAGLKDPERARALLAKLLAGLPVQPDVAGWYRVPPVTVGVAGDALVALTGEARTREAQSHTVANQGPSLAEKLPDPVREAYAHGPLLYAWVDLERAAELLAHGSLPVAMRGRVLRGLQGASLGIDARPGVISLDADLWPPPGGFAQAIEGAPPDGGATIDGGDGGAP